MQSWIQLTLHAYFVACRMNPVGRLLCPKALGIDVQMPGGVGILVPNPLKDPADFEARIPKEVDVKDKLSHVIQAVVRIKEVSFVRPLAATLDT